MLIWRALHTKNHCRRFQHCLGWEGGGQWPKQCVINRATDLHKAFFTNIQFCACFFRVSQGLLARVIALTVHGLIFKRAYYRKDFCVWDLGGLFWEGLLLGFCDTCIEMEGIFSFHAVNNVFDIAVVILVSHSYCWLCHCQINANSWHSL